MMMPRKKRRLLLILSIIVILIILAIAYIVVYQKTDMLKTNDVLFNKYATQIFQNMEPTFNQDNMLEMLDVLEKNKLSTETTFKVNYKEDNDESNTINKVEMSINGQEEKNENYNYKNVKIKDSDNDLMGFECINEQDVKAVRLDKIKQFLSTEKDDNGISELNDLVNLKIEGTFGISDEQVKKISEKYLNIIKNNISNATYSKKKGVTLEIDGKRYDTNSYSMTITKEKFNDVYIKVLEEIKKDDDILSWLDNIDKKICSYTNKDKPEDIVSGYYLRCRMGKAGAEICEADVITHYKTKLEPGLVLKNYIEIPEERIEKSKIHYDEAIEDQWVIMDLINGIFFEGKLKNNFFTDAKDMNIYDDCLKQSILKSRNILANWFWRGEQNQLVKILDDVSLALIKNSILNDETFAAQRKFNLRWSLLEYLDDQEVGVHMSEIRNQLREHINVAKDVEWDFISDEEYSYAVGQAVSYLLHLSKANNKTESYVNPFFNAKNSKVIKQRLLRMYKKYNYQIIHINGGRNAQLLSHVMEYEPKEIKHELIMAGFTAPSLMYEKKTDDEDNE